MNNISINIIEVKETNAENEDYLHWRLLTNLECNDFDKIIDIINIYKARWNIECFHRILKSVFGIEKARLNSREKLEKLATILSIISWHIFWLYMFSREFPDLCASIIYTSEEIKILEISANKLKVKIPKKLTIGFATLIIARLGGFLGRKNDGLPGMEVIWKGWRKLCERVEFMKILTYG